ncbi:MAG: GNAT family N-acetyltransferase [Rubricella sp.]
MIETERLRLRDVVPADAEPFAEVLGDPEVMRFSHKGPMDASGIARWIAREKHALTVETRSPREVIGLVALRPKGKGFADLVYRLKRSAQGKGYAIEAVRALCDKGFADGLEAITGDIDPDNEGSLKLARRLGMVKTGTVMHPGYDHPDHVYTLRKPG